MITFVPAITLLACTIFPATTAYPIFAKSVNAVQARCGDCDTTPGSLGLDIGTVVDTTVGTHSSIGSTLYSDIGAGVRTPVENHEDDIWIWVNDLNTKVGAKIQLLDGNSNPSQHCQDIIALVNSSLAALSSIKVYSNTRLTAIVKIIVTLYIDLAIALGKYNASILAACGTSLWVQLDSCLKSVIVALGAHYSGFYGQCSNTVVGLGTNLTLFTNVGLDLCAKIFFGTAIHA